MGVAIATISLPAVAAHAAPSPQDISRQLDQKTHDLEKIVEQYDKVNAELTATRAASADVSRKLAPLNSKVDSSSGTVNALASAAYKGTQISAIGALLTAGSPDAVLDQLATLNQIAAGQQKDVNGVLAAKRSLDAEKKRLDGLQTQQAAQERDLAAKKATIQADTATLIQQRNQLNAQQAAASRSTTRTVTSPTTSSGSTGGSAPSVSGKAGVAVRFAYAQLGKPYVFGAAGPDSYDCSGLTMAAWGAAGVNIGGHYTQWQWNATARVDRSQLQPGDLVFFYGLGHVGIYVGNGMVIHAPQPGDVVKLTALDAFGSFDGAGRPQG